MPAYDAFLLSVTIKCMDYRDIIQKNCECHSKTRWWPKFAYHFTDIRNAACILTSGRMYSRATAQGLNIMSNDNASQQVIDMTDSEVISHVRLYFRPQTPTQYYNEGYKHPALRFNSEKLSANVPLPVFLLFDLEKLLSLPNVSFSETTMAGRKTQIYSGIKSFSELNFDYIYDNSTTRWEETKSYRHAEILIRDYFDIDDCISNILCRNSIEQTTLLNLLREKATSERYNRLKDIIKVYTQDTFYENGFFVQDCVYHKDSINITFSDTQRAKKYIAKMKEKNGVQELAPIDAYYVLEWLDVHNNTIKEIKVESQLNIQHNTSCKLSQLPNFEGAVRIGIKVFFEKKLMCYVIRSLQDSEFLE